MEEHESQVLQVECSMECSLLGEQEQSHSAAMEEHESQVLQVECSMECSLLGEQEQSQSAAIEEHESEVLQLECSMESSLPGEQEQNHSAGEELEQHTPAVENGPIEGASNVQETQRPLPEVNNSSHLEDDRLIARARAVGVDYEFPKPGEVETEDDRTKDFIYLNPVHSFFSPTTMIY
ncbi:unnamed protein product [Porites lobata]|uniref:Uncharacterized protein n=1 Tax=Porites lobata TaxID=104759 RepID=A0ABN8S4S7_9CNID|nr:unnamed protein product [Porites lobata]